MMQVQKRSSEDAVRVAVDGLPEALREEVSAAYRALGGSFSRPSVRLLRLALRAVRRKAEDAYRWRAADDLTKREDVLEHMG